MLRNSSTISLLRLITPDEWKAFVKFVSSPYFNKGRNYGPLVEILGRYHPAFESDEITKERIYEELYPGRAFKGTVMNTMLSGLGGLCEDFFVQQEMSRKFDRNECLLRQYSRRGYRKGAAGISAKIEASANSEPVSTREFYCRLESFFALDDYFVVTDQRSKRNQNLVNAIGNLICFFVLQSSIYRKELLASNAHSPSDLFESLPLKIMSEIDVEMIAHKILKEKGQSYSILAIYNLIRKALEDLQLNAHYQELKDTVNMNINLFDLQTGKKLLQNMQMISVLKINLGKNEFQKESYLIMKQLFQGGFYDDEDDAPFLRPSRIRTMLKQSLLQGDIDFAEKMAKESAGKVEPALRKALANYCMAEISFARNKFDDALMYLSGDIPESILFRLDMRRLMAKIYLETGSADSLNSLLDAFAHFLKNTKSGNKDIIERNRNFIRFVKKISKLSESKFRAADIALIGSELRLKNVSDKKWITSKLAELESGAARKEFPLRSA